MKTYAKLLKLRDHPWMVGVQFHPEFKSKPIVPHPLFQEFVRAMIVNKKVEGKHGA